MDFLAIHASSYNNTSYCVHMSKYKYKNKVVATKKKVLMECVFILF